MVSLTCQLSILICEISGLLRIPSDLNYRLLDYIGFKLTSLTDHVIGGCGQCHVVFTWSYFTITSLAFLYVAPILSSTQLPYLIQKIILCSTISNISICACLYSIVPRVLHKSASLVKLHMI